MSLALRIILLTCTSALILLTGCDDSDSLQADRAARFTTATKPAPNPRREPLPTARRIWHYQPSSVPFRTGSGKMVK